VCVQVRDGHDLYLMSPVILDVTRVNTLLGNELGNVVLSTSCPCFTTFKTLLHIFTAEDPYQVDVHSYHAPNVL